MTDDSKQRVEAEDLLSFRIPGDVQLSMDGRRVVWTERYIDAETKKNRMRLVGGEVAGTTAPLDAEHASTDSSPRFSPTGDRLAFVRGGLKDRERIAQLCLRDMTSGQTRVLVEEEGDFGAPAWSPDGRHLAFAFRRKDPVIRGRESAPVVIEVKRMHYKNDGEGYLPQDRFSLYRVDTHADEPALERLTDDGDWDDTEPVYSPDGTRLAFMSGRREDRDRDFEHVDLYVMPADGGPAERRTRRRMYAFCPSWSPDGSWLALPACPGPPFSALFRANIELLRVEASGEQGEVSLTADLDRCVMHLTIDDLWGLAHWQQPARFAPDGERVFFPVSHEGTTWLAKLELDLAGKPTGAVEPVIDDVVVVTTSVATSCMAMITTSSEEPGKIVVSDHAGEDRRVVARPLADYCQSTKLVEPIEMRWKRGDVRVHGWLLVPHGHGPHPLLLNVHGGPVVQYGSNFFHEMQFLAAQGFAVLCMNPRGSQGYGADYAAATHLDWATKPFADLIAAVDLAVAEHPIDADRLGVLGGSYGGYMTTWIVAHDHRFRAACVQRTVASMEALLWADFGSVLGEELGGWPWTEPERYHRMSPVSYASAIETPVLVMQGLGDQRTPPDQGERLFVTLRVMGKDAEMVLFPGAGHGLSRGGPARQRIERLHRIAGWFRKHLLAD